MARPTLKEQAAADLAARFSTDLPWVEAITYNGTPGVPAFVSYGEDLDERPGSHAARAEVTLRVSDVPDPDYRHPVVIGSHTWRVAKIIKGDGQTWTLELMRDERKGLL